MELDAKAELTQTLIPLALVAVSPTLEAEPTELAGQRYRRDNGRPALARYGSNRSSVRPAGQRVPRVRNVAEGKEVGAGVPPGPRCRDGPGGRDAASAGALRWPEGAFGLRRGGHGERAGSRGLPARVLDRGLSIDQGVLAVIDGSKGLRAAVRRAFERPTCEAAKTALRAIRADPSDKKLSAAKSLDERFEQTLTPHRLGVFRLLGIRLKTTNCLESIFSQVETRTARACNWKSSPQKHRRLASALLDIEPRLRRIRAYRHLPRLREAIQRELGLVNTEANERTVA